MYATIMGGAGWLGHLFEDGIIGGIHCGAGAAGGGAHIALFANASLLAWISAHKVAISCLMAVIPAFIDYECTLLDICIVSITLLMTSAMVLMLSSSSSDNSCVFVVVPGTPTPLPEINICSYASPKCCFVLSQS